MDRRLRHRRLLPQQTYRHPPASHHRTSRHIDNKLHLLNRRRQQQESMVWRHVWQPHPIYPVSSRESGTVRFLRHHAHQLDNHSRQRHDSPCHGQRALPVEQTNRQFQTIFHLALQCRHPEQQLHLLHVFPHPRQSVVRHRRRRHQLIRPENRQSRHLLYSKRPSFQLYIQHPSRQQRTPMA